MKHSRFFLGISTALLAIAGVAATKAHRSPKVTVWYYTKINPNPMFQTCTRFALTRCTKNGTGAQCFFRTEGGTQFPYYTKGGVHVICARFLFYNPQ